MVGIRLTRHTFLLAIWPERFIDKKRQWSLVDIESFNKDFIWRQDPWKGYLDTVQKPMDTYMKSRGDCEDYAVLIASILKKRDVSPLYIGFLREFGKGHVVCCTEDKIYSSGNIIDMSFKEYQELEDYKYSLKRRVN